MQVTMDGEPAVDLPANWERYILLGPNRPEVTGFVLDSDTAAEKSLGQFRIVCVCGLGFIWLVAFGLTHVGATGQGASLIWGGWVIAVVTPVLLVLVYYARRKGLYASLPERSRKLPPPGTKIRIDASGLTIGERSTEWRDVAIDRVDFENMGGRRPHNYLVHQIDVRTKDFAYTLDGVLMEQGAAIVAETYRHKLPTTT